MPTYDYQCQECGKRDSVFQSIGEYSRNPTRPTCSEHGIMERRLSVVPAMSGLANALAGDRHYEGMVGANGEDIGSRTKHREYMKRSGLTTIDDFKGHFDRKAKERDEFYRGEQKDTSLRQEITSQVMQAVAQPD